MHYDRTQSSEKFTFLTSCDLNLNLIKNYLNNFVKLVATHQMLFFFAFCYIVFLVYKVS